MIENQIEKIFRISNSSNNILLFVNLREDMNLENYYHNLNYVNNFSEKFMLKPNFVNLIEYQNKNDKHFEYFIINSMTNKNNLKSSPNILIPNDKSRKNKDCFIF